MLWKCCTQYASKFGKLSSGHRTGKVSFHSSPKEKWRKLKVKLFSCVWLFATPWSLRGSSIHGIFQARILEEVAISFSRSSQPRDWTQVSCIVGRLYRLSHQGSPRMIKLAHDCSHLTHYQSNAQNSPSQASTVRELWTSRCSSWIYKRQRNQRSNCQHPLDQRKQENSRKTFTSASLTMLKPLAVWKWKLLSSAQLFVTPWTIQSTEFSRPEYWSQ